jgi:hypothetical protein
MEILFHEATFHNSEQARPEGGSNWAAWCYDSHNDLWFRKSIGSVDSLKTRFLELVGYHLYKLFGVQVPERFGIQIQEKDVFLLTTKIDTLNHFPENFVDQYLHQSKTLRNSSFHVSLNDKEIPLRGLGKLFAVGLFLDDLECIGPAGTNAGWIVRRDRNLLVAQTIKIDPDSIASFFPSGHSYGNQEMYDEFGKPKKLRTHGSDLLNRHIPIHLIDRLSFEDLMKEDKSEFIEAAHLIVSQEENMISLIGTLCGAISAHLPRGYVANLQRKFLERRKKFLAGFAPELLYDLEKTIVQKKAQFANLNQVYDGCDIRRREAEINQHYASFQSDHAFQLPKRLNSFTGRHQQLKELQFVLQERSHQSVISHGIAGMGGVGKTSLAIEYAHEHFQAGCYSYYSRVIWFHAETAIDYQVKNLAEIYFGKNLNKPTEDLMRKIYKYLSSKGTSLIVWDNALSRSDIEAYLPSPDDHDELNANVHCLITSRDSGSWKDINCLMLEVFTLDEAREFVRSKLGNEANAQDIDSLIACVDCYPLALSHAVQFVATGGCPLQEYPRRFYYHQIRLCDWHSEENPLQDTVKTSFLVTLIPLQKTNPESVKVLRACVGFQPDNIPCRLLSQLANLSEEQTLAHLQCLEGLGLISIKHPQNYELPLNLDEGDPMVSTFPTTNCGLWKLKILLDR